MAFSSLLPNQMVSHAEAATGGFTLNSGKTNPGGTQMMTKAMAFDMYNLAVTASTNGIAVNQLMQKSFWLSGVVSYGTSVSYSQFTTASAACAVVGSTAMGGLFTNTTNVVNGTVFYTDANLTSPFQGIGYFQVIGTRVGRLSSTGVVSELQTCVVNSVSFTSWYYQSGTNIYPSTSGTVTIVGASATFNARAVGNSPSSLSDVLITINGVSRTAVKYGSGTTNSTTFSLAPGTYSYSVSVSFDDLCSGGIVFTQ